MQFDAASQKIFITFPSNPLVMRLFIILGILVIIVFGFIVINNQIIAKKNKIKEAFGSIDAYLKKRFDLIPNLVMVVKKYASYEKELLIDITRIRSGMDTAKTVSEKMKMSNQISTLLSGLKITMENYPDLKADGQFLNLQYNLTDIEEQLSAARRTYNAAVIQYNNKIQMFPASIVAGIRGDKKEYVLEAIADERTNPNAKVLLD